MWLNKEILNEDLESISNEIFIPWNELKNTRILVTGATGLIGFNLVCALLYASKKFDLNLKVIAQIRDEKKANNLFADFASYGNLEFLKSDIEGKFQINAKLDYIIHGANPTASEYFVKKPVELIEQVINGTTNMLELAREHEIKSFLYLSTMEIYGAPKSDELIYENSASFVDSMMPRSSYPEAKRLSESLCASYASEYGINAKVARLAQCFGPGVSKSDNRVFAHFARCVENAKDIELQTNGISKRPYIYTADAISAILTILLKGKKSEAYNTANEKNYYSIKEMAELLIKELNDKISLKMPTHDNYDEKFSPPHMLNLSMDKLKNLGWSARIPLIDMFKRMLK